MLGLGSRLHKLRLHLQCSRTKMADKLGLHPNTINRYERDDCIPGAAPLSLLQKEFDVSMDWLLFAKGSMFLREKEQAVKAGTASAAEQLRPEIKEMADYMEQDPVLLYEMMLFFHKYKNKKEKEQGERSTFV